MLKQINTSDRTAFFNENYYLLSRVEQRPSANSFFGKWWAKSVAHTTTIIKKMTINPELPIKFSRTHRLQWEEAQQKDVILYPEGMVELNQSSAEILKLCDGTRNLAQIVSDLEQKFNTSGLTNDITAFLEVAIQNGWINQN